MSGYHPPEQLVLLAGRLTDGELDDSGLESLRLLLRQDPAAAEWFFGWMELNVMLRLDLGDDNSLPLMSRPLLPTHEPKWHSQLSDVVSPSSVAGAQECTTTTRRRGGANRSRLRVVALFAVAASVLMGSSFVLGLSAGRRNKAPSASDAHVSSALPSTPGDSASASGGTRAIATVSGGIDTSFEDGASIGSRLKPGVLRLKSGIAKIAFDCGAVVVLEGPAELELVDATTCRLLSGSLSADVLPDATGFSVVAGGFRISERDAQFGLRIGPQLATELHSFGGNLRLVDYRGSVGQVRQLSAGEAIRWQGASTVTGVTPAPDSFVTGAELARRQQASEERALARWRDYSQRWLTDPAVVLRYDFAPTESGEITNTVNASEHVAASRQATPRWIAGRWSNKYAMLFDGRTDVLEVPDHADLRLDQSFSLAVWVRTRSCPISRWTRIVGKGEGPDRNYGLWMHSSGQFYWQVCPDRDPESQKVWDRYSLFSEVCPLDEWQLVVGVKDRDKSMLYVDGEMQNTGPAPEEVSLSDVPVTIGFYADVPGHDEYFCGELDELILLNRALTAAEIQQMYEAGKSTFDAHSDSDVSDDELIQAPPPGSI